MALACPRCGTQNPDGNAYCQACGTPLAAPVAVTAGAYAGPPPGMAPPPPAPDMSPPPPPPGYQAPYYTPRGPVVQTQRTPWALIIAGVLVLTVLMAGAGTALAIIGNRSSQSSSSGGGIADVVPSPTPGLTPSPVASPTTTTQTGLESNDGFTINVPSGWSIDTKDNETMVFTDPNGEGSVTVSSGGSVPSQTSQNNKDTVDSSIKSKYPDTRECSGTSPVNGTFNGVSGISWQLCFTLTSGANSVPAAASLFAGANASGSVYYLVMVVTTDSNLNGYLGTVKPLITTVHWKLS